MTKGLVLEGGGLRGLFSAGIMDVLMTHGVTFDGVVGVSAGACFGCNYKSGQAGRVLRYNLRYAHDPRYCSLWSLLTTGGIFGPRFAYYTVPIHLDRFSDDMLDWILASSSMPLVSRIVNIGDRQLLDGGIADSWRHGRSGTRCTTPSSTISPRSNASATPSSSAPSTPSL